jgi:hypothetical protein
MAPPLHPPLFVIIVPPGRLGLTLAIDSGGVGAKTTNVGCAGVRKEATDGSAMANATAMTARTVNDTTTT